MSTNDSQSESKFAQGLLNAARIVEFGVICVVLCLGVITFGAATAAMYRMFFRMRNNEPVCFKDYFDEFGNLFKNTLIIELIQIGSGIILGVMAAVTIKASSISQAGIILCAPVSLLFIIWILVFSYVYAHQAYFGNDVKTTFNKCFTMTFGCLLSTTALLLLSLIIPTLYFLMPNVFVAMIPVWVVLLVPLINWWNSYFYLTAFEGSIKGEDEQDA